MSGLNATGIGIGLTLAGGALLGGLALTHAGGDDQPDVPAPLDTPTVRPPHVPRDSASRAAQLMDKYDANNDGVIGADETVQTKHRTLASWTGPVEWTGKDSIRSLFDEATASGATSATTDDLARAIDTFRTSGRSVERVDQPPMY